MIFNCTTRELLWNRKAYLSMPPPATTIDGVDQQQFVRLHREKVRPCDVAVPLVPAVAPRRRILLRQIPFDDEDADEMFWQMIQSFRPLEEQSFCETP
mmetsp:Transcript_25489/g.53071  ORF Transcript_25489/g.53071 Transcript_25489/m.53071 type:complete len:98 (-) Transcript_25489:1510-1803(-)